MIEAKTQLAKLLATEDITVRHSATATTASFDVKNRVLTLPIWTIAEKDVLDMMTGHECAHALWTNVEDWEKAILELSLHKGITNIVEDARIEKKIKRKYPGLTRDFVSGYKTLEQKHFFYEEGKDPQSFNLLDRINLAMKMGPLRGIQFSSEESFYVNKVELVETFDDVIEAVQLLMEYMQEQQDEQAEQQAQASQSSLNGFDSDSGEGDAWDSEFNQDADIEFGDGDDEEDIRVGDELPDNLVTTQEHFDSKQQRLLGSKKNP